jgi:hypothetical protein
MKKLQAKVQEDIAKWKKKSIDAKFLDQITEIRERAETEAACDLRKPIQQLLSDVHDEAIRGNIVHLNKRMTSMMVRVAMSNDRISKILTWLTVAIVFLTVALIVIAIVK